MSDVLNFGPDVSDRELRDMWRTVRDCVAGEARIKAGGETYLPRSEGMSLTGYRNWLKRTTYLNVMRSTLDGIIGAIFRKPTIITFPDERLPFVSHGEEYGWDHLAQYVIREVLTTGRLFAIVVPVENAPARHQAARLHVYRAEEIDHYRLSKGRLACVRVIDASCGEGEKMEFRIGEDGLFEAARVNARGETVSIAIPSILGRRLAYIPGTFFGSTNLDPCPSQPPMIDLAKRSLAFYVLGAEYRQALFYTASPQPVATGFAKEELPKSIGPSTIISSRNPAARFTLATFSGDGLGEMRAALTELKIEMAALGASMLLPKNSSNVAARTVELRQREDASVAVSVVGTVEDGIERLMRAMLDWEGNGSADASIQINKDLIDATIDANLLRGLREAYQAGMISWDSWIEALQRGEIVPPTRSAQDERDLIDADDYHGEPSA